MRILQKDFYSKKFILQNVSQTLSFVSLNKNCIDPLTTMSFRFTFMSLNILKPGIYTF